MGAFKLLKMTMGALYKKPETVLYPLESKPQPEGLKGHIEIAVGDCILCGMCERSCTTNCLAVDKPSRTWSIDRLQCVQCGYCITVCPKKCLSMDKNYASPTTVRERFTVSIPEKEMRPVKKDSAEKKPVAAKPAVSAPRDTQLEALIGLMDDDKAAKVRSALELGLTVPGSVQNR